MEGRGGWGGQELEGDPSKPKVFTGLSHHQARAMILKATVFLSHLSYNSRSYFLSLPEGPHGGGKGKTLDEVLEN